MTTPADKKKPPPQLPHISELRQKAHDISKLYQEDREAYQTRALELAIYLNAMPPEQHDYNFLCVATIAGCLHLIYPPTLQSLPLNVWTGQLDELEPAPIVECFDFEGELEHIPPHIIQNMTRLDWYHVMEQASFIANLTADEMLEKMAPLFKPQIWAHAPQAMYNLVAKMPEIFSDFTADDAKTAIADHYRKAAILAAQQKRRTLSSDLD